MLQKRKCRWTLTVLFILCILTLLLTFSHFNKDKISVTSSDASITYQIPTFELQDLQRDYEFDMEEDVLIFLHIQKTGGTTFEHHLVEDLEVEIPCECYKGRKRCLCENAKHDVWIFSRFSTGWACGLHADWTEMKNCVTDYLERKSNSRIRKRYLYLTVLRDPVRRYVSEWKHVQRGATWLAARLHCDGRSATLHEVPFCFHDEDWAGVTLEEFSACPHNLANNRQTRMLANLSLIGCYNTSVMPEDQRNARMLESAKENLRQMAFFGITEFQTDSKYLFEQTFHIKFSDEFGQEEQRTQGLELSEDLMELVTENNRLDIELYRYAKELFRQRLEYVKSRGVHGNSSYSYASTSSDMSSTNSDETLQREKKEISLNSQNNMQGYSDLHQNPVSQNQYPNFANRNNAIESRTDETSPGQRLSNFDVEDTESVRTENAERYLRERSNSPERHRVKLIIKDQ